jgi:hypothetical protein
MLVQNHGFVKMIVCAVHAGLAPFWNGSDDEPTDASIALGLPWLADRSSQSPWLVASCGVHHRERTLRFADRLGRPAEVRAATPTRRSQVPPSMGSDSEKLRPFLAGCPLWSRLRSCAGHPGWLSGQRCEKRGDVVESRLTNRRSRACVPAVVARHADMPIPLPTTKSYHLAQHCNLVSRPRRVERLNVGCPRRLQLVSPPFGSNNSNPQNEPLPCTRRTVSRLSRYASQHKRSSY